MPEHISWSEGARAAREAESRRGRRVGREGGSGEAFASGTATCASCGEDSDASRMMRGAEGPVCEGCYFLEENPGGATARSWVLQSVGAVGPVVLGLVLLAVYAWAVFNVAPPTGGGPQFSTFGGSSEGHPLHFPMLAGGLFGLGFFFAWPLFRLGRSDASLHGLTPGVHRALALTGLVVLVLGAAGFVASLGLALAGLPPIPSS